MNLQATLTAQYATSHALHQELSRVRDMHGDGFTDDPHYLMLSTAVTASGAVIDALRLLQVATKEAAPAS